MKKILITGGAGFVGSNLANKLAPENEITIIDNLSSGNLDNLTEISSYINFIEDDICSPEVIKLGYFDEIYHLACLASPPKYQKDGLQTLETCYTGTKNVLNLAYKYKSKVLFSSTSEVYGDSTISPQKETYTGNVSTTTVRACYDEGKRVAETLCYEFYKLGVDVRIARLFNTYGSRMDINDGRVVSNFITQLLTTKILTTYGSGLQTRSFCYINDTLVGLEKFMEYKQTDLTVLNIGNDEEISIKRLANLLQSILKIEASINFLQLPEADPTNRRPDINKANILLNWSPTTTLENGLKETIAYFRKQLKNKNITSSSKGLTNSAVDLSSVNSGSLS